MADKIIIGKIGAVRGIHGELKIIPLTDFIDRFDNLKSVEVGDKLLNVDYVKHVGNNLIIRFKGYEIREEAQKLTNKLMTIDKKEAAPLDDGEFYIFDIVGLDVFNLNNERLGEVENVLKTGSNDVFVTKSDDGREILIPALKSIVKKIDINNKIMLVDTAILEEI